MRNIFSILLMAVFVVFVSCNKDNEINLDPPENIYASSDYALKILVSWDEVDNAEGYNVYRAEYNDFVVDLEDLDYANIGTTSDEDYEDLSVESSSAYVYKIEAYNGSKESDLSEPVIGYTIYLTADEAFTALAEYTGGERYDAYSAEDVPDAILEIIDEQVFSNTDLVFLIDNTASMWDDIDEVKSSLSSIIDQLPSSTLLAMAVYNDANEDPTGWYEWFNFTNDYAIAHSFLEDIDVYGGGDTPESVYDGIYVTVDNLTWSSSAKRMIIVIGDAPPLEGSLTTYSLNDVIAKCASMSVDVNLYPVLITGW